MVISLLAAAALSAQAAAAPERIEFGHANWDKFPRLERSGHPLPYAQMVEVAELVFDEKQCEIEGQCARRFDITIPYAVYLGADGKAERVLVKDLGCAPIQNLVGEVVYQLSELGDFEAGDDAPRWYPDEMNLTLE